MWVVPEGEIAGLMTPEAAFDAVEAVFAAMARGDARNFPVVREALANCVRHADAQRVEVHLSVADTVSLTVTDDGGGAPLNTARVFDLPLADTDPAGAGTGGLRSMRERAERRGGTFLATDRENGGTYVHWQVPLAPPADFPSAHTLGIPDVILSTGTAGS